MNLKTLFEALPFKLPTRPGEKRIFGQLVGDALPLSLAAISSDQAGFVVAVVPDPLSAAQLERALSFFLKDGQGDNAANSAEPIPILSFPDWETLVYDHFSPHQDIISERLITLYRLPQLKRGILIVPMPTLMHRVCPKAYLYQNTFLIKKGEKLDLNDFRKNLIHSGYRLVPQVLEHGEFAIRGSLVDLFPMGSSHPYRLDLFDQEIDSIRQFDVETQRSSDKIEELRLLPAREFPLDEQSVSEFRNRFRDTFEGDPRQCTVYLDVSEGNASPGLEYYLPLFFEKTATLFDYLPENCLMVGVESITKAADTFWEEVKSRYEQYRHDRLRPILDPKSLFIQPNEVFAEIKKRPFCHLQEDPVQTNSGQAQTGKTEAGQAENGPFEGIPNISITPAGMQTEKGKDGVPSTLAELQDFLTTLQNESGSKGQLLITAETKGRREILKSLLSPLSPPLVEVENILEFINSSHPLGLAVAPLEEGFIWQRVLKDDIGAVRKFCILPEARLLGKRVMQRRLRRKKMQEVDFELRSIAELSINAPVVHLNYGIGRYLGLKRLVLAGEESEFMMLEYAGGDKLYVPVTSLYLVSRYSGVDLEHAPLSRLGSGQWEKVKKKVLAETRDVARELLEVYAKREAKVGRAFPPPDELYQNFAAEFPFEETPDQERAIQEVIQDLISTKPMDRVVCGDVGFGKTEVALRAAFLAVQAGTQVAILVPTTLLAEQHFQTFSDRFANFPFSIEVLSRFKAKAEQEKILEAIKEGKTDIVIGTHKLLQKDVKFKRLGLLIIDEEHRFGVQQKETFKRFRAEVDILTLTATPIPRTLNMAMSGMRDLSIIATPPAKRLSIKTFVREKNTHLIQEAIMREVHRGGQVYYLHNDIDTIENTRHDLEKILPGCRIAIAHGQMRERELEQVMSDFYHRKYNVLVCSTIIETGIDIPTANTIIIERADKFGLAQLHQLRGRVGRSHHQAYAFCLTPSHAKISADAKKRLEAFESLGDLGIGFTLATHDLEIRGAGELLGEAQSGNIQSVGFPLFMELLDRAVKLLKAGGDPDEEQMFEDHLEMNLHIPSLIPEGYVPDVYLRLLLYKRISNCKTTEELSDLKAEMIDRFGDLPSQTENLFKITALKFLALPLGIQKIEAGPKGGRLEFNAKPNVDPAHIMRLLQENPKKYSFEGPQKLRIVEASDAETRMQVVSQWVESLRQSLAH